MLDTGECVIQFGVGAVNVPEASTESIKHMGDFLPAAVHTISCSYLDKFHFL